MDRSQYVVRRCGAAPEFAGDWDGPAWGGVPPLRVAHFHAMSSDHRPDTQAKLLHDGDALYGIFRVNDRYVRCVATEFQGPVWADSCVEIFIQPAGADTYLNFEMNCGGALLSYHMIDPILLDGDHRQYVPLTPEDGDRVLRRASMPPVVEPERAEPTTWFLEFAIPFDLLAKYTGSAELAAESRWRANLFKCADATSHPHWASWSPLPKTDVSPFFHQPQYFGALIFEL